MAQTAVKETKEDLRHEAEQIEQTTGGHPPAQPQAPVVARPVRRYRALVFQGYVIAATITFAILFILARQIAYFTFDVTIERAVQNMHSPWLDVLMRFVSGLGFNPLVYMLAGLIILFMWVVGLRWEAVMAIFAAGGVSLFGVIIKISVGRERPTPDLVNVFSPLHDYSFPSGHVLLFTAFLGFLLFLIYTLIPKEPRSLGRALGIATMAVLISLVGISRVYLGQHWPSDVIGAYLFGSLWLALTVYVYRWGKPRFFVTQPVAPA